MRRSCLSLLLVLALLFPLIAFADTYRNTLVPVSAVPNQKLATRSGPGTEYSEENGTLPKNTSIVAYVLEGDNVWVMIECNTSRGKIRCYTGKKRVNTKSSLPKLTARNMPAYVKSNITPYYGPGKSYAPFYKSISSGTPVTVVYDEQGYALIDYWEGDLRLRSWVPLNVLQGYKSNDVKVPQTTEQPTARPTELPSAVVSFTGTWVTDDPCGWKLTLLADHTFFLTGKDGSTDFVIYGSYSTSAETLLICQPVLDPNAVFNQSVLYFEAGTEAIRSLNRGYVFYPLESLSPDESGDG